MCLMGGKAASHPCSHKGENIKCSKNNHQHLMYTQSLYRWERRYLNCSRLPVAWWVKLPICKQQMDRENIKSHLLIFGYLLLWATLLNCVSILFWGDTPWFPCQPMCRVQSRRSGVGRSPWADRWATTWPLHSLCSIHSCTWTFCWRGTRPLGLWPLLGSGEMHNCTFLGLLIPAPVDFERKGCLWWLF